MCDESPAVRLAVEVLQQVHKTVTSLQKSSVHPDAHASKMMLAEPLDTQCHMMGTGECRGRQKDAGFFGAPIFDALCRL